MSWQQSPSILSSFQPPWLSWQSPFLSTFDIIFPPLLLSSSFFLHHGVSRAEFSLTEPVSFQAVYVDHNRNPQLLYGPNRERGKPRKQTAVFFRQSATPVENSSNIYFKLFFITNYKKKKTQGKVGSYTGESILLEDQVHIARRPMTSRRKNEHKRSNVLAQ